MDIKELALRVAEEASGAKGFHWDGSLFDFVEPFLAAYHAEQEPVSLYPCGFKELNSLVIKNGAYLARGMYEGEPVTESIRSAAMVLIGYAKDMSILLAKQPLYAAPPEPAQNLYREIYEVWAGSEGIPMPRTAPEAYLLGLLEQMVDIAKTGMHMTEPAPQQETVINTPVDPASPPAVCAAPSSEEVDEVVERLRTYPTRQHLIAADALESLEQQVAALTKERDELEISNAFAHGEWRAVKDQLAALTTERDELLGPNPVEQMIRDQLDAAQARESKLREALELIYNGSTPAKAIARFALKAHTDDSALQERLKAAKVEVLREAADVLSRSADVELYEPVLRRMADELEKAT